MCGIVAYSSNKEYDQDKINFLMYWNSIERGTDSTGVYSPKTGLIKSTEEASKFINSKKKDIKLDVMFIGHVRAKTRGMVSEKNAHPFKRDALIGVHNGTITNMYKLSQNFDIPYNSYDVDSDGLYAILGKKRNPKVLGHIEGGAALVFTDTTHKNPNIMYVYRNEERPLYRGHIGDSMYISSIKNSLEAIGCDKVQEFKPYYIYTILNGKIVDCRKIPQVKKEKSNSNPYNYSNTNWEDSCDFTNNLNKKKDDKSNDRTAFSNVRVFLGKNVRATIGRCDRLMGETCNITRGRYYKVVGCIANSLYTVNIIDDKGIKAPCSIKDLELEDAIIQPGDWCIATETIIESKKPSNILVEKGKCFLVKGINITNREVETSIKGGNWTIPFGLIRKKRKGEIIETKDIVSQNNKQDNDFEDDEDNSILEREDLIKKLEDVNENILDAHRSLKADKDVQKAELLLNQISNDFYSLLEELNDTIIA